MYICTRYKHFIYVICLLLCHFVWLAVCKGNIIGKFTSEVGAGNFTYYTLREPGDITLLMHSSLGDADMYISEHYPEPSFENYNLSSTTCGLDAVFVPNSFKRPTYVGIYGHIHSPISRYTLVALLNHTDETSNGGTGMLIEESSYSSYFDGSLPHSSSSNSNNSDESSYFSSIIWDVLETLFKILLEILL